MKNISKPYNGLEIGKIYKLKKDRFPNSLYLMRELPKFTKDNRYLEHLNYDYKTTINDDNEFIIVSFCYNGIHERDLYAHILVLGEEYMGWLNARYISNESIL